MQHAASLSSCLGKILDSTGSRTDCSRTLLDTTLHLENEAFGNYFVYVWDDIWHLSLLSCPQGLLLCYKRRPDFSDHTVFWWLLPNTLVSLVQSWELYWPAYGSVVLWLLLQLFSFFLKSLTLFSVLEN